MPNKLVLQSRGRLVFPSRPVLFLRCTRTMLQCKKLHIRVFPFAFCIGSCIPFLQKEKRKKKKYYKISVFLIKKINVTSDPSNLFLDSYNTRPLVPASSPRTLCGAQNPGSRWLGSSCLPAGFVSLVYSSLSCPLLPSQQTGPESGAWLKESLQWARRFVQV